MIPGLFASYVEGGRWVKDWSPGPMQTSQTDLQDTSHPNSLFHLFIQREPGRRAIILGFWPATNEYGCWFIFFWSVLLGYTLTKWETQALVIMSKNYFWILSGCYLFNGQKHNCKFPIVCTLAFDVNKYHTAYDANWVATGVVWWCGVVDGGVWVITLLLRLPRSCPLKVLTPPHTCILSQTKA